MNDSPQPQVVLAFGLSITNFDPDKSSTKSRVEPNIYGYDIESNKIEKLSNLITSSSNAISSSNLNPY